MFEWLAAAVMGLIRQYGYLAVFVYMALETGFVLHYVPSEVVVPFAASQLVHDPVSFALFVIDATAGATVGSLIGYTLFGRYGRAALERYGRYIHVTPASLERSEAVFIRYGESSVFWGRLIPFLRAFISIPAGIAEMDLRRFVLYSAGGTLLFNTGLTYLVYKGAGTTSPLQRGLQLAQVAFAEQIAYVQAHTLLVLALLGVLVILAVGVWVAREWIREHPEEAKLLSLHAVRLVGVLVGTAFVVGALSDPGTAFDVVTAIWNDPAFLVTLGFSEQLAIVLTGVLIGFIALFVFEVGTMVKIAHLRSIADRVRAGSRR